MHTHTQSPLILFILYLQAMRSNPSALLLLHFPYHSNTMPRSHEATLGSFIYSYQVQEE